MQFRDEFDVADSDNKAAKEEAAAVVRLSGCGISAIGVWDASMEWTYQRIIERGGIPEVTRL